VVRALDLRLKGESQGSVAEYGGLYLALYIGIPSS